KIYEELKKTNKPVEMLIVQMEGGSRTTIANGIDKVNKLKEQISKVPIVEGDLSDLNIALECGSSDAFSGISANPAVGEAADIITENNGTVVLSEITEMVGAENVLSKRAKNDQVKNTLLSLIKEYEIEFSHSTEDDSGRFISPGNIE